MSVRAICTHGGIDQNSSVRTKSRMTGTKILKINRLNLRAEGGNGVESEPRAMQMAKQQPAISRGCEKPSSDDAPIMPKHSQVIAIPTRRFLIRDGIGPNAQALPPRRKAQHGSCTITGVGRSAWFGGVSRCCRFANRSGTGGHTRKETPIRETVLVQKGDGLSDTWTTVATNGPVEALREPPE